MSVYRRERSRGFTMVELMVVIAIIAILVVALAMGFSRMNTHARTKATRALAAPENGVSSVALSSTSDRT